RPTRFPVRTSRASAARASTRVDFCGASFGSETAQSRPEPATFAAEGEKRRFGKASRATAAQGSGWRLAESAKRSDSTARAQDLGGVAMPTGAARYAPAASAGP